MEKSSYEELTESKRQNHRKSVEKFKADASEMIAYSRQLKGLRKHFDTVEANINKRSRELELKEKQLQILSLDLDKKSQTFEEEKSKAGDLKKLVEEYTEELRSKRNQLSEEMNSSARIQRELELKSKELEQVKSERVRLCNEARKVEERNRVVKEETARKTEDISLILGKIEESSKQLATVDEQLESLRRRLGIRSVELVSTEKKLGCLRESIELSDSDFKLKESKIQSLNNLITDCSKAIDTKSQELEENQKLIEQQTNELRVLQNQHDTIKQFIQVLSEELVAKEKTHKEILETICRSSSEMEVRAKEIKAAEAEATDLNVRSERFRQEVKGKEKELDLLKNQIESEEKKLIQFTREMEEETDRKKRDLALILDKIEGSGKQLATVDAQLESRRKLLIAKEMELECVAESSNHFKFDIEVNEKRVQALNNLITISGEQLDMKSKELGEIQRELELKKKRLRHMSIVLVKQEKQPAAAETALVNEDALTHHEFPAPLSRHEVSSDLRALPNPAEFVLEEAQEHLNKELGLPDSLLEILVIFFEELTKIQRSDDPQLQDKATQVATLWKGKITIEAPKSSLEALAFLLFIVAYGLKKLINDEEAAFLASSIAHYEQAPRLFKSLSLNIEIRKFVKELIKKNQYIPAVRLICLFKLNGEFLPSHLLSKEIINLRWSALESRPTKSPQAKDKDAGRLRAILELVADYKLEINLPGDLIAKLMIQRENSPPQVRCCVEHGTSSSNLRANSPNPASAQSSSVNLQVPKLEVKPYLN